MRSFSADTGTRPVRLRGWAMKFPDEPCRCELNDRLAKLEAAKAAFPAWLAAHDEYDVRRPLEDKHRETVSKLIDEAAELERERDAMKAAVLEYWDCELRSDTSAFAARNKLREMVGLPPLGMKKGVIEWP